MQRAAEKADRYLQTLRAVNTAETSPQEPIQRVQVQEILTRCANDAKLLCDNKNIQFVLNNAMENVRTIPAQRQALGRALDNILENAVRFTPAGGTITLDAVEEGQKIVFTVTDTGPGFSPEACRKRAGNSSPPMPPAASTGALALLPPAAPPKPITAP